MKISFTIVGTIDLEDGWGTPEQIQREIQHDFVEALQDRACQWSAYGTPPTTVQATVTTHPHIA